MIRTALEKVWREHMIDFHQYYTVHSYGKDQDFYFFLEVDVKK